MKFGPVPASQAVGCVLAHSLRLPECVLKKGRVLSADDVALLQAAGVPQVVVVQLHTDDVPEDEAAAQLAAALCGPQARCTTAITGRANLLATAPGLVLLDAARIHAINAVHESLTVATLPPFEPVASGQMLATIKVIPYAVPRAALAQVLHLAQGDVPAVSVAAFVPLRVGLVLTRLADTRESILDKMRTAVVQRLQPLQAQLQVECTVQHDEQAVAAVLRQMTADQGLDVVLISGIAATVDRADVVPAGLVAAGGQVWHAGMPVDPGNLLVLGSLGGAGAECPVVGLPTCARSPKLNGFDFVLRRLAARLPVTGRDIMQMGVGGLLTEIETRPMPRETQ
jgi:molybdenum cofactor cytidylyltransferase